jgi:hypothetical protein
LSSYDSDSFAINEKSRTIHESIPNPKFGKKNRPYFQKKSSQVRIWGGGDNRVSAKKEGPPTLSYEALLRKKPWKKPEMAKIWQKLLKIVQSRKSTQNRPKWFLKRFFYRFLDSPVQNGLHKLPFLEKKYKKLSLWFKSGYCTIPSKESMPQLKT